MVARIPTCHPERPHHAKGLCRNCYEQNLCETKPGYKDKKLERSRRHRKAKRSLYNEKNREYYSNPKNRERLLTNDRIKELARYGITLSDEAKLLDFQNHSCALCGRHKSEESKSLALDHDHQTGELRGLLCRKCNMGLGLLGDTLEALRKAVSYFENPPFRNYKKQGTPCL